MALGGGIPSPFDLPRGCAFADAALTWLRCREERPELPVSRATTTPPASIRCDPSTKESAMPHHVLTAEFAHEGNTFRASRCSMISAKPISWSAAIAERGVTPTPSLRVSRRGAGDELEGDACDLRPCGPGARGAPGADDVADKICNGEGPQGDALDGILLSLHGAMVTEFCEDGEGELLTRLRAIVGPDMPIAISLDLRQLRR